MLIAQISRTFSAQSAVRIPMIKFRKGGLAQESAPPPPPSGGQATQTATGSNTYVYEMEDMPMRFRRQQISQEECDIINGGGIN